MKRISAAPVMFFLLASTGYLSVVHTPLVAQQKTVEQVLIQLELDWCAADVKKDAGVFARLLSDDVTLIGSRGSVQTKAEFLASLSDTTATVTACAHSNVKVRVYGEAAVVTGQSTRSGTWKGAAFKDRRVVWIDTFVKKNGQWQCVASQGTLIAAQQKN